ncbi:MAG: bifunctional (p)ppGpp synthetase/guanosine-3',5'-bis(diphosphate) 3'-pyrophosphohydrolase [Prevotella ruminicola]|jgi:GTP pyrophosphokinase|uniref:Bifunctional (P)ppGpp synthetase/guanosine-3',5'-bis(Diphosphate) 3'-pyrophosphohydrolase n=1 Tax=Xylanibacter ruminicola TaxID=839 RepID=A0A9D5PB20_XYLRU|nr:bifunctional (p)ppGpp synthetase/guanosine-3',5'-bis(diphosphate) 3'-pyrophosphohydrolase [Xylanibacter ruminicola]
MTEERQLTQEEKDDQMINEAFQQLLNDYISSRHRKKVDLITKAFNFARQAHKGVRRLSGEPYIMHPIAVAQIACSEVGLGSTSICAALLHDVVEDTDYTVEDIENIFGAKIAQIVDGLTKISGGIFGEQASAQAENFKKLLLTMSDDIRVIIIKICDRLHNMRTLDSQPANKQYKIAGETLYIYAPLANRLGLNKIKSELENLSFKFEHPDAYAKIEAKLKQTREDRDELFSQFTSPIESALKQMGIKYEIKERVKTPYSIWNKMQNKHVSFEEIYDILAVRIIFTPNNRDDEVNECFKIYVAISKIYKSHPDRLRDWLSQPKANGYQALHVTLMSKTGQWIEVQIRSDRMDEIAEQGFAAHWKYKDGVGEEYTEDENELNEWLRTIKEILDDPQPDAMDFLDTIKLNLFASEIFVFTPKGEIRTLPAGCTALDFAFSIHTFLGSHCIGAKVNHKLVPLSYKLQSGDQVEILTSKSQHVNPAWINFVSTAKAKAKIQAILRRDNREVQREGEDILTAFLKKNGFEPTVALADKLAEYHEYNKRPEFFQALGEKIVLLGEKDVDELNGKNKETDSNSGWRKFVPFVGKKKKEEHSRHELFVVPEKFNRKKPVYISEENYNQFKFMGCCHPIPGDDALGYINNKNQIEIHKRACPVADKLKTSYGNRILDIKWDMHKKLYFDATIRISGIDRLGMLSEMTQVISSEMNVNIHKILITCEEGIFEGTIEMRVHDRDNVRAIIENLKKIQDIKEISEIM